MKHSVRNIVPLIRRFRPWAWLGGVVLFLALCFPDAVPQVFPVLDAADSFKFESRWESRSSVDTTRKQYADVEYPDLTMTPVTVPKEYDKNFVSSINDLTLTLKGDLSPNQFLDFKEILHFQTYRPEDYDSFSLDSYRYRNLDHLFNLTYGISFGSSDFFQLDYFNNVYQIPIDNLWEYNSNMGKAKFSHRINQYTGLSLEGGYEEREYVNDRTSNYSEGSFVFDLSTFLPEKLRYRPIGNTVRGERSTFEKIPTGMATRKAVDYYTTWTRRPDDGEAEAKYLSDVMRGDLFLDFQADLRTRKRVNIDNGYFQPSGIFKATYDWSDKLKLHLEETYYQRKFDRESDLYYLYDHRSNKVTLGSTYQPDIRFTHILSFSNEYYDHFNRQDQDYLINSALWETFYSYGRSAASLNLKATMTRYGQPRAFYVDNNQFQAVFGYDYPITPKLVFHLKDEWVDTTYDVYEDLYFSSSVRNTWRVALERILSKQQGLEIGYQDKRETHRLFNANDITEKSLFLSWLSHF